jgi:hypothetical protein
MKKKGLSTIKMGVGAGTEVRDTPTAVAAAATVPFSLTSMTAL